MSIAPAETETDTSTEKDLSLSDLPDFDEVLPCQCALGEACPVNHGENCPDEAEYLAVATPCGCRLTLCSACTEMIKQKMRAIRFVRKIPFFKATAACSQHAEYQIIEDITFTPI